jgi:hypothetical protein
MLSVVRLHSQSICSCSTYKLRSVMYIKYAIWKYVYSTEVLHSTQGILTQFVYKLLRLQVPQRLYLLQRLANGHIATVRFPEGTMTFLLTLSALRPTQPPLKWVPALFPGGKAAGRWRGVDHPPHLLPRLKKEQSYTSTPAFGLYDLL